MGVGGGRRAFVDALGAAGSEEPRKVKVKAHTHGSNAARDNVLRQKGAGLGNIANPFAPSLDVGEASVCLTTNQTCR